MKVTDAGREPTMKPQELTQTFREHTAAPPVGARERVWRALDQPPAARRSPLVPIFALAASMVLGIAVVKLVQSRRPSSEQFKTDRTAILWNDARAKVDAPNHITLETGAVAISAWGAPVEIAARGHVVKIDSGLAVVTVANDSVTAEAIEGVLTFDGQPHVARARTESASQLVNGVLALETDSMRARRLVRRAEQAAAEQRFEDAVKDFETVASSGTLDAEVANFKQAELELRRLNRPDAALATLAAGDQKFSTGALAQERQLSTIESLVKLERWAAVERNTSTFLTRFADSERADEVRRLHEDAVRRISNTP